MKDLKQRTIRGGFAKVFAQVTTLLLRTGSLMIMARLLAPKDFGLVGMVTAVIGVFTIFRDIGLSAAAIQRATISNEQSSTLFWINLFVGATLSLLTLSTGPLVANFYHEPRLIGVTAVLAMAFLFNAAGVQHFAILERQMRFVALSVIDISSLLISTFIGVAMALGGFGYWSLVATSAISPLAYTIGVWLVSRWIPGKPRRNIGIVSMMRFGSTVTINGLIWYIAINLDRVLLGRFWGIEVLGIYGRASQLVSIPTDSLTGAAGGVAFAALSRLQTDPDRLRSYFLKGYSVVLSLSVPIALMCAAFSSDIIRVFLGTKWNSAVPIFRILAPTTLGLAIITPLGWLLSASGMVAKNLRMSLAIAPVFIAGYFIGLPWGAKGVAIGYSLAVALSLIPLIIWAVHGTPISPRNILQTIGRPLLSGLIATGVALVLQLLYGSLLTSFSRLAVNVTLTSSIYIWMLMWIMGQGPFYLDIIRSFRNVRASDEQLAFAP